jgi:hypothetical protein
VLPWIGVIPLQQLSPVDLNQLYRRLLESDRKRPGVPQRHPEAFHTRATELRAEGHTHEVIAAALREEFPDIAANITRFAVAALLRRGAPKSYVDETQPGLSPRTVRYIHTIIHAALKDALRWSRVVRNVADAATPPSVSSAKSPRVKAWTAEQLRRSCNSPPRTATSRPGSSWPRAVADEAKHSACAGQTSISTMRSPRSATRSRQSIIGWS